MAEVERRAKLWTAAPEDVVRRLQDALIAVMQGAATTSYAQRYEKLAPVIEETHDLPTIARLTLGRAWSTLSDEQQRDFARTFHDLSIATYAARFDKYAGERFTGLEPSELHGGGVLIKTRLRKSDGKKVHFDYMLHRGDAGRWKILNIVVDGVSDLALKRVEYADVLKSGGFSGLIAKLQEQVRSYREGREG